MKKIFTKKGAISLIAAGAAVFALAGCGGAASGLNSDIANVTTKAQTALSEAVQTVTDAAASAVQNAVNPSGQDIGEAKAKAIALEHAGLKEDQVTFILSRPDFDDGRHVYDVEFYQDMKEFDYEIDAATGEILSFDADAENYSAQPQQNAGGAANGDVKVTLDDAKKMALERAGLKESDVTFTDAHLEYDDGRRVYQIDFISGTTEYEYEIDANTGNITEYDGESIFD